MKHAIFISYRRDDSEGEAGRLYDDLIRVFGPGAVFMDVSDIHPGKDFRQAIDDNVSQCAVLLAIIGPAWATLSDPSGTRRLDQPNDFVRLEVASALARGTDVIPVLVHGARMPAPAELPGDLQTLAYRNAVELTHARWNSDVEVLSRTLREYVHKGDAVQTRVIRRAIEGDVPADTSPLQNPAGELKSVRPAVKVVRVAAALAVLVGVAILGAATYIVFHHKHKHQDEEAAQTSPAPPNQAAPSVAAAASVEKASSPAAAPPASPSLAGIWIYPQAETGQPDRIDISAQQNSVSVHLWTKCAPVECDMGSKTAPLSNQAITLQWNGQFSSPGSGQPTAQTVNMRIYRLDARLHIIYWNQASSTGFDFIRGN